MSGIETAPLKSFATWARTALVREVTARIASVLAPGSTVRIEQAQAVSDRYQEWFEMAPMTAQEEWVRLDGVRR